MQVGNAARAGAEYVVLNGYSSANIKAAVTSATGLSSIAATPDPTSPSWGCPNAVTGIVSANQTDTCPDGSSPGSYVTVYAQASYRTIFPWPGIPNPVTLTARATVRVN
jgi:hypothetical protein